MQLSAWASNVVGTNTQLIPRYKVEAAKPETSWRMPPPMDIKVRFFFAERSSSRS
ncbi:MAG: hypothetical protein A4E65_01169 [Syntrophorhabdus sp. PtaU1.Bin153]|nr:MAG: hypothetical protein A4E65_01169 [Syntrophorhabdus sp. PtaU1.Bin153]